LLAEAFGLDGSGRERFFGAAAPGLSPPGRLVPAQLPFDVPGFTGRERELAELDGLISDPGRPATAVVISALFGTAGVGKTALAVHFAQRIRHRFPDGQLYVNLRGFDPTGQSMPPADAIRGFLDALHVAPQRMPPDLETRAVLYRSLLAGTRTLIVLDNARDAEHVRPLLPGAPGCLVLITSRSPLTGLVAATGAHPVQLDLLTDNQARELLARRLGRERVAAEPQAVTDIVASCARLPLALAVVAARAVVRPDLPLAQLAGELRERAGRLDALFIDDCQVDVRSVFSWSYRALSPAAARLLRLLGGYPGSDITPAAAASLAGVPIGTVRPLLAELTHSQLVTETTAGRYTLHDLLRAYAAERAAEQETDQAAALDRVLDHHLHTGYAALMHLYPHRVPISLPPPDPAATVLDLPDAEQARAWYIAEHRVLLALVDAAAKAGRHRHTWQLAWTVGTHLSWRGHWHDQATVQLAGLDAAVRLGDPVAQAHGHHGVGVANSWLGNYETARHHFERSIEAFAALGEPVKEANVTCGLVWMLDRQERYEEALIWARQALQLSTRAGWRSGQANSLNSIGWMLALLGRYQEAMLPCEEALALGEQLGNAVVAAAASHSLGYIHHNLGRPQQAIAGYQHALSLYRHGGDRYYEALTLTHLGDAHHTAGQPEPAREAWQNALDIYDELNAAEAEPIRIKLTESGNPHEPPQPTDPTRAQQGA
jgi:tetratricopeptide (TPR) repeat protein